MWLVFNNRQLASFGRCSAENVCFDGTRDLKMVLASRSVVPKRRPRQTVIGFVREKQGVRRARSYSLQNYPCVVSVLWSEIGSRRVVTTNSVPRTRRHLTARKRAKDAHHEPRRGAEKSGHNRAKARILAKERTEAAFSFNFSR